jgi:hypothetical protein
MRCKGEGALLIKTDILKEYYNFTEHEQGATNGLIWNRINRKYKSIFTNHIVRRYHTEIPDSMSNQRLIRHPEALAKQGLEYLNDNSTHLLADPTFFLKSLVMYQRYSYHARQGIVRPVASLQDLPMRLAAACMSPVAAWFAAMDRRNGRV